MRLSPKELIPENFEIEHIFPKKWQSSNYNGWSKDDAKEYLERFGNKTVIEKERNILAGNGYFGLKKDEYKKSDIACVIKLSKYRKDDWKKEDIEKREKSFKSMLKGFLMNNLVR